MSRTEGNLKIVDRELDLECILNIIIDNARLIFSVGFISALLMAFASLFLMDEFFESHASIDPQIASGSGIDSLSMSSSPFRLLGIGQASNQAEKFSKLLNSRNLAVRVIADLELFEARVGRGFDESNREDFKLQSDLVKELQSGLEVKIENGFIDLSYAHTDPDLARAFLQSYLNVLSDYLKTDSFSKAQSTEKFLLERIEDTRERLAKVEKEYISLKHSQGVVQLESQASLSLGTASDLRSKLIEKDLEIELYKEIMKDSSKIASLRSEREHIKKELDKLIGGSTPTSNTKKSIDIFTPLGELPELQMRFANAEREYFTQGRLLELLQQEYELARIETKKEEKSFQIIDPPSKALFPVWPPKKILTIFAFFLGSGLSVLGLIILSQLNRVPPVFQRVIKLDVVTKSPLQELPTRKSL